MNSPKKGYFQKGKRGPPKKIQGEKKKMGRVKLTPCSPCYLITIWRERKAITTRLTGRAREGKKEGSTVGVSGRKAGKPGSKSEATRNIRARDLDVKREGWYPRQLSQFGGRKEVPEKPAEEGVKKEL